MQVAANRDVCIGAGLCALTAPAVFDQDDEGLVVVLMSDVSAEQAVPVNQAVDRCPSGALRRLDDGSSR